MLFDVLATAVNLMRKASTSTGLRTTVYVINRLYERGRKATQAMKDVIRLDGTTHSNQTVTKRPVLSKRVIREPDSSLRKYHKIV